MVILALQFEMAPEPLSRQTRKVIVEPCGMFMSWSRQVPFPPVFRASLF